MIQVKIENSQINEHDEWVPDETGWRDLDSLIRPIREAGYRGTGEITVEQVRSRIAQRLNLGETEGRFRYPPRVNHDQTQNEFGFNVFWRLAVNASISAEGNAMESPSKE